MRVVTSSFSYFHMYHQAAQLAKHMLLSRFISGPPAYYAKQRGIPYEKVDSLWLIFALGYLRHRTLPLLPLGLDQNLLRFTHDQFSKQLAKKIPSNTDIFIGLSSFCKEAIETANARGITTIVDHGSLHEAFEREQLIYENDKFGFLITGNSKNDWLIEKQQEEFSAAKYIFTLSNLSKKTMIEHGVSAEKIIVNHCGVSLGMFSGGAKRDKVFRIAFCGQVSPRKGLHYLLQAFAKLNAKDSELWVIGSLNDLRYDSNLRKMIQKFQLPNIKFWGGVDTKTLVDLFSQCSVFVHPSVADGFGMVVTQAMACGLPVIVSDHTGASDVVVDGKNGFVVPARHVDILTSRLQQLYDIGAKFTKKMGQEARLTVQQGFTWDDYGDRLCSEIFAMSTRQGKSKDL